MTILGIVYFIAKPIISTILKKYDFYDFFNLITICDDFFKKIFLSKQKYV